MTTFLFKTEPSDYSFDDLVKDKVTRWAGVNNGLAQQFLRQTRPGDDVLIYHTGDQKAIVGMAEVVTDPYEDPDRPGLNADGEPRHPVVDITPIGPALTPLTLADLKKDTRFADFLLLRQPRLSVMLVPDDMALQIKSLTGLMRTPTGRGSRGTKKLIKPSW